MAANKPPKLVDKLEKLLNIEAEQEKFSYEDTVEYNPPDDDILPLRDSRANLQPKLHPDLIFHDFAKVFIDYCKADKPSNNPEFKTYMASMIARFTLHDLILQERAGKNPHGEGTLRAILQLQGAWIGSLNSDIVFGAEIKPDVRLFWQQMGIDPDSEDNVSMFLKQFNVYDKVNPGTPTISEQDRLDYYNNHYKAMPRPTPRPKPY